MSADKKRENGYYFVKFKSEIKWRVCFYEDGYWYSYGYNNRWDDINHPFYEINEEMIINTGDKAN